MESRLDLPAFDEVQFKAQ